MNKIMKEASSLFSVGQEK